MASEETPRGLTEGKTSASREEAGSDGSVVWRGDNGEQDRGLREEEARESEAAGWSAERQVVGKPETGTSAEGAEPGP